MRNLPQADLIEALDDELYTLRERQGADAFPDTAQSYLNDWAENDKGWLRKFYPTGTDEPHFDLTPATEKALVWLEGLTKRAFVGTESRLLTLFDLLRQMSEGSQTDPEKRIKYLKNRRKDINREIARIEAGDITLLDDTGMKDRFQQFLQIARELLTDFREVEQNFRTLDRTVRERIAQWYGAKGALLEEVLGERDVIANSDQGKSFRAFWDFLMSQSRQEEFSSLLVQILSLQPIQDMRPDARLRRIHHDWLEAGEHTQRTVAKLSGQLRRFLDDKAFLENRRIMDILSKIENKALSVRENLPTGEFMSLAETSATVELPLERPLYRPPFKPLIANVTLDDGDVEVNTEALYTQVAVNRAELKQNIRQELQARSQVTLADVISKNPLRHGLTELLTYVQLASEWPKVAVYDEVLELVSWRLETGSTRKATLPQIILLRN